MLRELRLTVSASIFTVALVGCGGGGGADGSVDTSLPVASSNPNAFPKVSATAGDYYVYSVNVTPTLPTGLNPRTSTFADAFTIVNPDTSETRTRTFSDSTATTNLSTSFAWDASGRQVSTSRTDRNCTYSPAYRPVAPRDSVVGDAYSSESTYVCQALPSGTTTSTKLTMNGKVQAAESINVPAGTFETIKITQTESTVSINLATTAIQNYWIDKTTGRTVKFTSVYSQTPIGKTAPTYEENYSRELVGYSFRGQAPVGAAVRRFAGNWSIVITESNQSNVVCAVVIDSNGQISGNECDGLKIMISGIVDSAGNATATADSGASITGSFTSPSRGSGAWKNASASGTWTATHQ